MTKGPRRKESKRGSTDRASHGVRRRDIVLVSPLPSIVGFINSELIRLGLGRFPSDDSDLTRCHLLAFERAEAYLRAISRSPEARAEMQRLYGISYYGGFSARFVLSGHIAYVNELRDIVRANERRATH
jgi:hypothetical protein